MNYYTSDFHLGSTNIIRYAHRPFADAKAMHDHYFKICNKVLMAESESRIFHVGDFALAGNDKHDGTVDHGIKVEDARKFLKLLPNVVLLNGNHDAGHNFPASARCMLVNLGHHYKPVSVGHYPSVNERQYEGTYGMKDGRWPHIHLCGHVHDAWLLKFDPKHNVLNVNIGPDVWNQKLVAEDKLVCFLDYFFKYLYTTLKLDAQNHYTWTRAEYEDVKKDNEALLKIGRENRRAKKLEKKGITPEEAERRRIEAMKKKGLMK